MAHSRAARAVPGCLVLGVAVGGEAPSNRLPHPLSRLGGVPGEGTQRRARQEAPPEQQGAVVAVRGHRGRDRATVVVAANAVPRRCQSPVAASPHIGLAMPMESH
jgi:hypothetical protein